jgi:DNA repair exonuclease SbcCD ATPase subunit
MGWFGRSRAEREEIQQLRGELAAVQERLVESVRANTQLGDRLRTLDTTNTDLAAEVADLRSSNVELSGRLSTVDELTAHVEHLDARLIPAPTEPPPPPSAPAPSPTPGGDHDAADAEREDAEHRTGGPGEEELADLERRMTTLADALAAMDERITSVSTELANQLTELGTELDAVNARGGGDRTIDDDALRAEVERALEEAMDEIQGGQERLAAEQARYQIQFRQDLAELADRLRRGRDAR